MWDGCASMQADKNSPLENEAVNRSSQLLVGASPRGHSSPGSSIILSTEDSAESAAVLGMQKACHCGICKRTMCRLLPLICSDYSIIAAS